MIWRRCSTGRSDIGGRKKEMAAYSGKGINGKERKRKEWKGQVINMKMSRD